MLPTMANPLLLLFTSEKKGGSKYTCMRREVKQASQEMQVNPANPRLVEHQAPSKAEKQASAVEIEATGAGEPTAN
ncbi:hypothetical protein GOP47_0017845 [Adiantum capillus-veneris]|uniref:Uncharacterized protein n=1 Tax=Adiantum capillus-veneris TaxID=13818 RepID=A0A9D4UGM1_ADICA|nr:hypothetical protein GOP47_0017845 [Adiantum capillus-veneris]